MTTRGWVCPLCDRVYGPHVTECLHRPTRGFGSSWPVKLVPDPSPWTVTYDQPI